MNTSKLINVEVIKVSANKLISNFAIALVTAIGLTSDSTCLGGKIFGMGYSRNFPLVKYNALRK